MTGAEFSEALALAQFLPGGNILNLGVAVGQRYRGVFGSLACTAGLVVGPFILVTLLAGLYLRYGQVPAVHNMLTGEARWRIALQAGLVPVTIGLVCASAYVIARTADTSYAAIAITVVTAVALYATNVHPILFLAAGAALGLAGLL